MQNKLKGILMVSARDFLGLQHVSSWRNGGFVIVKSNLISHEKEIKSKDTVRGEIIAFNIYMEPVDENNTVVTTIFLIDPKGSIPTALVNTQKSKQLTFLNKSIAHIQKNYW